MMALKFKFFEYSNLKNLEMDLEQYCRNNEISTEQGAKHKLVKVYNHSVIMPMAYPAKDFKEFDTIINKVMIVWDDGGFN